MSRRVAPRVLLGALLATGAAGCAGTAPAASLPPTTVSATPTPPPAPATVPPPSLPVSPVAVGPPAAPPTRLAAVPASPGDPAVRFPANPAAEGAGAQAVVAPIPDSLWAAMVGFSWTEGCPVGRTGLRAVSVNFWGFDGVRSRGTVVVAAAIADRTAAAFTALYDQQFRIRTMRPMDATWGHDPKGPGADDYAAMAADNTSGFNCRYVGGEEARRVWSNHAYGQAIDINDVENPYVATDGSVFPSRYFLTRSSAPGVFSTGASPAVRAFTGLGFSWGGRWSPPDYQHMEVPR